MPCFMLFNVANKEQMGDKLRCTQSGYLRAFCRVPDSAVWLCLALALAPPAVAAFAVCGHMPALCLANSVL